MIFRHLLNMRSHPTWVRGLKLHLGPILKLYLVSHPTWVRGLKLEIQTPMRLDMRRTLRGCVD